MPRHILNLGTSRPRALSQSVPSPRRPHGLGSSTSKAAACQAVGSGPALGHPLNALVGDAVLSVNEPTPGASKSERAPSELKYPRTLSGEAAGGGRGLWALLETLGTLHRKVLPAGTRSKRGCFGRGRLAGGLNLKKSALCAHRSIDVDAHMSLVC